MFMWTLLTSWPVLLSYPFLGCLFVFLIRKHPVLIRNVTLLFPLLTFLFLIQKAIGFGGAGEVFKFPIFSAFHVNFSIYVDELSLFFGLVVSGVATLIFLYARSYMEKYKAGLARFYGFLLLFTFAMLGTVFSGNLIMLFLFWELTGIASFFLIGFFFHQEQARRGATIALFTTFFTGLFLLLGLLMLGFQTGTWDLQLLLSQKFLAHQDVSSLVLVLVLIGAMGKSAQFPFQYWLPNAMTAPTPVSAFLHSATMVKLGVFLIARFHPVFATQELWSQSLLAIGFMTLFLGALLALMSHDLKAILAYSTVSQLGFFFGMYGLSSYASLHFDFFHITNHVFYKAALFMMAGIIDLSCGTRDVRKLGGLFGRFPALSIATVILCFSMAGFPGTMGFVSKELLLTDLFKLAESQGGLIWLLPVTLVVSAALLFACGIRIFRNVFWSQQSFTGSFKKTSLLMQMPVLLLALASLLYGLVPNLFSGFLSADLQLHVWHGFNIELLSSAAALVLGFLIYTYLERKSWELSIPRILQFEFGFDWIHESLPGWGKLLVKTLQYDRPSRFVFLVLLSLIVLFLSSLSWSLFQINVSFDFLPLPTAIVVFAILAAFGVILFRYWLSRLVCLSLVGVFVTFIFVIYKAPDLALTQILIESATLILMLLFLLRFNKYEERKRERSSWGVKKKLPAAIISVFAGVFVFFLTLSAQQKTFSNLGDFFLENTVPLAHGQNTVNTILVDFRGYDTMGEITVLVIATMGVLGMLIKNRKVKS